MRGLGRDILLGWDWLEWLVADSGLCNAGKECIGEGDSLGNIWEYENDDKRVKALGVCCWSDTLLLLEIYPYLYNIAMVYKYTYIEYAK